MESLVVGLTKVGAGWAGGCRVGREKRVPDGHKAMVYTRAHNYISTQWCASKRLHTTCLSTRTGCKYWIIIGLGQFIAGWTNDYDIINRQLVCKKCPKPVAIQFSRTGVCIPPLTIPPPAWVKFRVKFPILGSFLPMPLWRRLADPLHLAGYCPLLGFSINFNICQYYDLSHFA